MECWSFSIIEFWEDHLGSDVVIAWWGFLVLAILTVPLCLYYVVLNYTNMFAYIYFMASIVFALAVFGILYTTYKANWESKFVWGILYSILLMIGIASEGDDGESSAPLSSLENSSA